jgi:predicted Zn finger-like uncharacterized protein
MILTCPSCGTQYVVKDGAVPPGGRQVRCAACKHSWHQDPEVAATAEPELAPEPEEEPAPAPIDAPQAAAEEESIAEATMIEPRSGPEVEERAYEEAQLDEAERAPEQAGEDVERTPGATYQNSQFDIGKRQDEPSADSDWQEPPTGEAQGDEFTPFPDADVAEPRSRSPILSILIVIVAVIVLAAAFWYLAPPAFKARLGLAEVGTSPLALVTTHMDRQRLESGNELLTVSGRVINPTGKQQDVPPLQAQLKTRDGKIVYSWTIPPPAQSLPPGASASFNSAELKVPPGGEELTITIGAKAG